MRTTRKMIDYQLELINEKYKGSNKEIIVTSCYGYYQINELDKKTTGQRTIMSGLTLKEVYNCLYCFNEISYLIKTRKEK